MTDHLTNNDDLDGAMATRVLTFDDVPRIGLLSDIADRRLAELSEATRERPAAAPTASAEYAAAVERFAKAVETLQAAPSDEKRDAADDAADAAQAKHNA